MHHQDVNKSLANDRLPTSEEQTIVTPLLKKSELGTSDTEHYWPGSNLSFVSKVVEWAVAGMQLNSYYLANASCSVYSPHSGRATSSRRHASRMAWLFGGNGQETGELVSWLDMFAAFDCVDHLIPLQRLGVTFRLPGNVFDWTQSFFCPITLSGFLTWPAVIDAACSVLFPQGTVLGPLLYTIHIARNCHAALVRRWLSTPHQHDGRPCCSCSTKLSACLAVAFGWTRQKALVQVMWMSWVRNNSLPRLTRWTCESCRQLSASRNQRAIMTYFLAVICPCATTSRLFVEVVISAYNNCDQSSVARRKMPRRRWSKHVSPANWTPIMRSTTSPTIWCVACSQSKSLPLGWWRALGDTTASRQFSTSCTVFPCGTLLFSRIDTNFNDFSAARHRVWNNLLTDSDSRTSLKTWRKLGVSPPFLTPLYKYFYLFTYLLIYKSPYYVSYCFLPLICLC